MRIVLFNWRDRRHSRAGGAELYTHHALSALAHAGHDCVWFSSGAPGLPSEERDTAGGYRVIRRGNELTCRIHAFFWLLKHRRSLDLVIDEVNTLPWLSPLIVGRKTILLIHQIAREVWLYEAPRLIGRIGFFIEPLLLRIYHRSGVITISASSAQSLRDVGLRGDIRVVECPLQGPDPAPARPEEGRVGFIGRVTPSKRVDHIIKAVSTAALKDCRVSLDVIGGGSHVETQRLKTLCQELGVTDRVAFRGRVSDTERDELLRQIDVLAMASVREGWGLVVSEAARFSIPTVAYDVAGLTDSVVSGETGLLVERQSPVELAAALLDVIEDRDRRRRMGEAAASHLRNYSLERFVSNFCRTVGDLAKDGRATPARVPSD